MNEIIITNTNGELTTSSLGVAEKFGKQHKHVIEKIGNIIAEMNSAENSAQYSTEKSAQYFIESIYIDNSGKSNKCYELTRDGFSLLVMGFTGKKALEWKLKYIEAFNLMEQKLREKLEINNTMDLNILTETIGTAISKVLTSQLEICVENAIQKYLPKPNTKKINTWKSQVGKPSNCPSFIPSSAKTSSSAACSLSILLFWAGSLIVSRRLIFLLIDITSAIFLAPLTNCS